MSSYGFDNIAGVLKMSPTLMERYLAAAQKISRLAVGTPPPSPNVDYFRVADDLPQDDHLPGMPLGTRGGTRIRYTFPMDARVRDPRRGWRATSTRACRSTPRRSSSRSASTASACSCSRCRASARRRRRGRGAGSRRG